jgi:hypothetical protein
MYSIAKSHSLYYCLAPRPGLGLAFRLVATRLGLATGSRLRLLAQHRSAVLALGATRFACRFASPRKNAPSSGAFLFRLRMLNDVRTYA